MMICKWWPMAKLEDGTILNTNDPMEGSKTCLKLIKHWDEENSIKEAWIDITIDDDPDPVKRIPLIRNWSIGKSIVLKEELLSKKIFEAKENRNETN